GIQAVSHRVILLDAKVRTLQKANKALSKRRRAKRTQKGVVEGEGRVEEENEGPSMLRTGSRLYGICRKTSHNARTCPEAGEIDSSSDSK
ncbi:hypothetical protein N657DRAFT_649230, partial [Parathielavia appendiculata]